MKSSVFPYQLGEGVKPNDATGQVWVRCSSLLENISTPEAKANDLDIADYLIAQLRSKLEQSNPITQSHFSPTLKSFLDQCKPLDILINRLGLVEIDSGL